MNLTVQIVDALLGSDDDLLKSVTGAAIEDESLYRKMRAAYMEYDDSHEPQCQCWTQALRAVGIEPNLAWYYGNIIANTLDLPMDKEETMHDYWGHILRHIAHSGGFPKARKDMYLRALKKLFYEIARPQVGQFYHGDVAESDDDLDVGSFMKDYTRGGRWSWQPSKYNVNGVDMPAWKLRFETLDGKVRGYIHLAIRKDVKGKSKGYCRWDVNLVTNIGTWASYDKAQERYRQWELENPGKPRRPMIHVPQATSELSFDWPPTKKNIKAVMDVLQRVLSEHVWPLLGNRDDKGEPRLMADQDAIRKAFYDGFSQVAKSV